MLSRFLCSASKRYQLARTTKEAFASVSLGLSRDEKKLGFSIGAAVPKRMFSLSPKLLAEDISLHLSLADNKEKSIEEATEDLVRSNNSRHTAPKIMDAISSLKTHFLDKKKPKPDAPLKPLGFKALPKLPDPEKEAFLLEAVSEREKELQGVLLKVKAAMNIEEVYESEGRLYDPAIKKMFDNKTQEELEALLDQEATGGGTGTDVHKMYLRGYLQMKRAQRNLPIFERIHEDLESALSSIARSLRLPQESSQKPPEHHVLVKEIEKWASTNNCLKLDYSVPRQLSEHLFKIVEVSKTKESAVELMHTRRYRLIMGNFSESKNTNFLIGIHSPPGGGKSLSLELIAGLGHDPDLDNIVSRLSEQKPDIFLGSMSMLKGAAGLTITHVGSFGHMGGERGSMVDEFLGWRILTSYFTTASLRSFVSEFRPRMMMTSEIAIKTIVKCETEKRMKKLGITKESDLADGEQPHIVLCVDEVLKSPNPYELLHILGHILDNHENISVVVSTLDAFYFTFYASTTSLSLPGFGPSGRELLWIHLQRLSMPAVLEIFQEHFPTRRDTRPNGETETIIDYNSKPDLFHALCMAGGHPRTLRHIKSLVSSPNFMEDLAKAMEHDSLALDENMICAAIRGDPLPLDHQFVLDSNKYATFNNLIRDGVFLNTLESHQTRSSIPLLSMLRIRAFFLRNPNTPTPSDHALGTYKCLDQIAALKPISGAIGIYFEHFHPEWEIARRTSFLDKRLPTTVDSDHQVPFFDLATDIYGTKTTLGGERTPCRFLWGSSVQFRATRSSTGAVKDHVHLEKIEDLGCVEAPFNSIYSVHKNNHGFDLMILEQSSDNKPIAILVELKAKSAESKTRLPPYSIRKKIRLCAEQFENNLKYYPNVPCGVKGLDSLSQVYIVFATLQGTSEEELKDVTSTFQKISMNQRTLSVLHPKQGKGKKGDNYEDFEGYFMHDGHTYASTELPNVIVLDRERLLNLYSPTLSYVPHFLSTEEILDVIPGEPITKKKRGRPSKTSTKI